MLDEIDHRCIFFNVKTTKQFLSQLSLLSEKVEQDCFLSKSTPHLKVKNHESV